MANSGGFCGSTAPAAVAVYFWGPPPPPPPSPPPPPAPRLNETGKRTRAGDSHPELWWRGESFFQSPGRGKIRLGWRVARGVGVRCFSTRARARTADSWLLRLSRHASDSLIRTAVTYRWWVYHLTRLCWFLSSCTRWGLIQPDVSGHKYFKIVLWEFGKQIFGVTEPTERGVNSHFYN